MSEINPLSNYGLPNQQPRTPAQNLSNARANDADSVNLSTASFVSSKDLTPLVKLLANRLQISELMAFKMIRKFMGTGQAASFNELKEFLLDFTKPATDYISANKQPVVKQLQKLNEETDNQKIEKGFQNITKNLKDIFVQDRNLRARVEGARLLESSIAPEVARPRFPLTELVSRPREFASWLVNNKAAFIALRANPEVTNILMALRNPVVQQSPVLMSQLVALLVQILKLKAGKSATEDIDEKAKADRDAQAATESSEHESSIVNTVKRTIESVAATPIREFLIEAERFAEEEVANLWSLTLKKERELEKKMKTSLQQHKAKRSQKKDS